MEKHSGDWLRRTYTIRIALDSFMAGTKHAHTCADRLRLLREFTAWALPPDPWRAQDTLGMRRNFDKRKTRGHYRLGALCWACQSLPAAHRHHVIAIRNGGRNRKDNVVLLCVQCHRDVHRAES